MQSEWLYVHTFEKNNPAGTEWRWGSLVRGEEAPARCEA